MSPGDSSNRWRLAKEKLRGVRCLFFDLDGTLWDHAAAQDRGLRLLAEEYGWEEEPFVRHYTAVNERCWHEYSQGRIDQATLRLRRFQEPLTQLGLNPSLDDLLQYGERYLACYVEEAHPMPGLEVLEELAPHYRLGILTNGFTRTQVTKLHLLGLTDLLDPVICSENAPALKPHRAIFDHAGKVTGHLPSELAIVGDSPEADISGGARAGWGTIWLKPLEGGRDTPNDKAGTGTGGIATGANFPEGGPTALIRGLRDLRDLLLG